MDVRIHSQGRTRRLIKPAQLKLIMDIGSPIRGRNRALRKSARLELIQIVSYLKEDELDLTQNQLDST